ALSWRRRAEPRPRGHEGLAFLVQIGSVISGFSRALVGGVRERGFDHVAREAGALGGPGCKRTSEAVDRNIAAEPSTVYQFMQRRFRQRASAGAGEHVLVRACKAVLFGELAHVPQDREHGS